MSRRAASSDYVLVAVPADALPQLEKFCRAIRIITAPDPNRQTIDPPREATADLPKSLTDVEVREFVHLLFAFALDTYAKGRRRSAAQCILFHVFSLVTRGRGDLAHAIVQTAKSHETARPLLQEFFESVEKQNWEAGLEELIKSGNMQKSLSIEAQKKISTSKRDNGDFIEAFKSYIARQPMDADKKRRLTAVYAALLAAFLLPQGAQAAPAAPRSGAPLLRLVGGAAVAIALLAGIVLVVLRDDRQQVPRVDTQRAEEQSRSVDKPPDPSTRQMNTAPSPAPDCLTNRNGFDGKACLIQEADRARPTYARSVALYKRAIAFDYDPTGLGKREDIPERYLSKWQSINAYESLATLHSENGQYREALVAHRERLRLKEGMQSGEAQQLLFQSLDCTVLVALERRANGGRAALSANDECMARSPYPSDVDTAFHTYELARAYEEAGRQSEALQALAATVGRSLNVGSGDSVAGQMTATRWKHLVDQPKEIEDARRRLTALLESLQKQERAIATEDITVWIDSDDPGGGYVLGILLLRLRGAADCRVDDAESTSPLDASKSWQVSIETGGRATEMKRALPGLGRNSPRSPMPWYGRLVRPETARATDVSVKLVLSRPATIPRHCFDQAARTRVCLLADGRLVGAERCP